MHRALPGILIGGVVGTVARWAIGEIGWSTSTTLLAVNTVGCALLGGLIARWPDAIDRTRLLGGIGFCGGLTTFSGLAVQLAGQLDRGAEAEAAWLLTGSLVLGGAAFVAGRAAVVR